MLPRQREGSSISSKAEGKKPAAPAPEPATTAADLKPPCEAIDICVLKSACCCEGGGRSLLRSRRSRRMIV